MSPQPSGAIPRSPGPPDSEAACKRHKPYRTKAEALQARAERMAGGAPELEPYRCPVKTVVRRRHWHLRKVAKP